MEDLDTEGHGQIHLSENDWLQAMMPGMKAWGEGEASEEVFVVVEAATDESDGGEIQGDGHRETVEVKSARLDINQMLG